MDKHEKSLQRDEVLRILGKHRDELAERYSVIKLGIFESVATLTSDVDVVVGMEKPDLFFMVHIKEELENALHCLRNFKFYHHLL